MGGFTLHLQRRFLALWISLGCAASAAAVAAQDGRTTHVDQACLEIEGPIEDAVRYVEKAQGTTLSTFCIKVVSKDAIEAAFDATARMSDHDPDLGGLYVIADETILIPSDLDLTRAFDLSFVVHEVLHVYQH